MMKTRILITCTVALAIGALLLLKPKQQQKTTLPEQREAFTNPPTQPELPKPVEDHRTTNTAQVAATLPPMTPLAQSLAQTNPVAARRLAAWQTPIEFYGKVIDENSNPVAGATIGFHWVETPTEDGNRNTSAESNAEGLFSLQGQRGPDLSVTVSKEGYYAAHRGQWGFKYGPFGNPDFFPDPQNPIIFLLRKKGQAEPLIHIAGIGLHTMRDYLLPADGRPTDVSLLTGQLTPAGQGDLEVAFTAGPPLDGFPSRIIWQCRITVPGGGLVPTSEEFPFIAPENGYQTSDAWSITASNWTEEVDQQYYVRLRDGNFGRIRLRVMGVPDRAFFRMESFVNPSSSRNLEPMEAQQHQAPPPPGLPPGVKAVIPEFK